MLRGEQASNATMQRLRAQANSEQILTFVFQEYVQILAPKMWNVPNNDASSCGTFRIFKTLMWNVPNFQRVRMYQAKQHVERSER